MNAVLFCSYGLWGENEKNWDKSPMQRAREPNTQIPQHTNATASKLT